MKIYLRKYVNYKLLLNLNTDDGLGVELNINEVDVSAVKYYGFYHKYFGSYYSVYATDGSLYLQNNLTKIDLLDDATRIEFGKAFGGMINILRIYECNKLVLQVRSRSAKYFLRNCILINPLFDHHEEMMDDFFLWFGYYAVDEKWRNNVSKIWAEGMSLKKK